MTGSAAVQDDADLRLPRPPGVIRRFWARHPLFADILIALLCLLLSIGGATTVAGSRPGTSTMIAELGIAGTILVGALILAACATLLLRRRMPLLPFALAVTLQLVSLDAAGAAAGVLLLVTTYSLAVYGSNRLCAIGAIAATALAAVVAALTAVFTDPVNVLTAVSGATVNTATLVLLAAMVGVNVGNRKRYMRAVLDRSRQLLVERDQQAELAAAAERERIAREMHDIVSHSLTVIVALSEGATATADHEHARHAMQAAAATARTALTEMRAMLGVLREGDPAVPLAPAVAAAPADIVAAAQAAGFPVTLTTLGRPVQQPSVSYAVGRIVQEGLTNAMRHAPHAHRIQVRIDSGDDRVVVTVTNDGVPAAAGSADTGGFGVRGLVERARHVGGTLVSGPDGAGCWLLRAELPVTEAKESA
ncbi:sensor histidine kinase [Microbacterium sp.]|uniref:sensor histidine kinase n=1 Tax=Microbacterium sp. TaxID=51671 RepID=UPI003A908475